MLQKGTETSIVKDSHQLFILPVLAMSLKNSANYVRSTEHEDRYHERQTNNGNIQDFRVAKTLGSGSFGRVVLVMPLKTWQGGRMNLGKLATNNISITYRHGIVIVANVSTTQ